MPKEKLPDLTMPVNDRCPICGENIRPTDGWGRIQNDDRQKRFRIHFPRCVVKTFTSDQLDAEWQRLAITGDDFIAPLEAKYQRLVAESEAILTTLRNYASSRLLANEASPTETRD